MSIEVSNPWWLLLIPVVVAGLIYSGRFLRIQSHRKKIEYLVMRGVVALLLILTLCGLSFRITSKEVTTIFLVDMSDSNEKNLDDISEYIRNAIADMPKKNQAGVVVFGDNVLVDQFVTEKKIFTELSSQPVATATNLEKAVSTAMTVFPEDTAKRLVLITDGLENAGSIAKMAGTVSSQNVDVKVIKLEQNVGNEVYVSNLELPEYVHVGDTFNVKVTIESNVETQALVSLYCGRTLKGQSNVNLTAGENQFVFQDVGESNGTQDYRVMVEPVNDTMSMNNEYSAFTQVEAEPKLLLVEGTAGEGNALAGILDACGVQYDQITPTGVPDEMSKLIQYKAVVMVNVNAMDLRNGFMDILESYVRDYAGGLICTGGDNSFAMGAYQDTPLETVLPVNMFLKGEREVPTMAIAMVIDHSGSMEVSANGSNGATCLDLAKEAAVEGVKSLKPTDQVGVLAFDDSYDWVVPMQSAGNQSEITGGIGQIGSGGGTSIYPALDAAAKQLINTDAQIKHIILLTDGQDYYTGYEDVVKKINDGGITLSTVAVGPDSDQVLLQRLANQCNGRFYYTDINSGIPKIFVQEIFLSSKSYLINEEFTPVITANSSIIDGVMNDGVPTLLGYIGSTAKSQATVILQSEEGDPILSTWQYGLGRTIAWNTDATNEWTGNWANWENYTQLWDNMINYVVSNTSLDGDQVEITQEGNSAVIHYTTDKYDKETKVTAVCTNAAGEQQEITLDPVAPGEYEASLAMEDTGVYTIALKNQKGSEIQGSMVTATAMQYSPEYRFDQTADGLEAFVSQVNGAYITYEDPVFDDKLETVRARTNLAVPFLITALVLFLLDIAARRMGMDYLDWFTQWKQRRKWKKEHPEAAGTEKKTAGTEKKTAGAEKKTVGAEKKAAGTDVLDEKQRKAAEKSEQKSEQKAQKQALRQAKQQTRQEAKASRKKKQTGEPAETEAALDMEELLRKKEDRNW